MLQTRLPSLWKCFPPAAMGFNAGGNGSSGLTLQTSVHILDGSMGVKGNLSYHWFLPSVFLFPKAHFSRECVPNALRLWSSLQALTDKWLVYINTHVFLWRKQRGAHGLHILSIFWRGMRNYIPDDPNFYAREGRIKEGTKILKRFTVGP